MVTEPIETEIALNGKDNLIKISKSYNVQTPPKPGTRYIYRHVYPQAYRPKQSVKPSVILQDNTYMKIIEA